MKKIIILIALITLSAICFVGCGNNSSDLSKLNKDNPSSNNSASDNLLFTFSEFSEDMNWVYFCDGPAQTISSSDINPRYGCIDKSGKMLFYIDSANADGIPTDYSNGYSYFYSDNRTKLNVLDKSGKVCSSYKAIVETYDGSLTTIIGDRDDHCVSFGDGYTVMQTHISDFDNNYYKYSIFDANGKELYTFNTDRDEEVKVEYEGEGVFSFKNMGTYFSKANKWSNVVYYGDFNNEAVFFHCEFGETESRESTVTLSYINCLGQIYTTKTMKREELGWDTNTTDVNEGFSIIHGNESLALYNIKTDELKKLTNDKYLDKIKEASFFINNGKIIVTMKGLDNESYFTIFDTDWNVISEPIRGGLVKENCGRIIVDLDKVYDLDGNLLFSFKEKGYTVGTYTYSDDVFMAKSDTSKSNVSNGRVVGNNEFAAFDINGDPLFVSIDFSHATEIKT